CMGGNPLVCTAIDQCHNASCDPATGTCRNVAKRDGTVCDDGNACTIRDACVKGACVGGASAGGFLDCDDGISCTADSCDPALGCLHVAFNALCDDANACTADACDERLGCVHQPLLDGTPCDDGNACTTGDTCQNGTCDGGPSLDYDDGDPCTIDTCLSVSGCIHTPRIGLESVRCILTGTSDILECANETIPQSIQRRIGQATNMIDRGQAMSNPKKLRILMRKAAKTLKKAANLAATAVTKGKLSTACG